MSGPVFFDRDETLLDDTGARLEQQQRQKLEALGILDRFSVIVDSDATKISKPDPEHLFPRRAGDRC